MRINKREEVCDKINTKLIGRTGVLDNLPTLEKDYLHYMRRIDRSLLNFKKIISHHMFWKSPKPTNLWEETSKRFEELIAVIRDYLFEVIVPIIVIVAIRLLVGAFR